MAVEVPTGTDKQIAFKPLERMPESARLDEIGEELAIPAAVRRGEAAAGR